jgi:hypothetical protein
MRRRFTRKPEEPSLSLDSFLDILANTLGVLIFIILLVTTQALNQKEVTIVAKTEEGQNRSKSPRYIECRAEGVVLYPSEEFIPKENLENPNSQMHKLIAQVKANRDKEYLIVALRPNGIDVFYQVRNLVEKEGIDIGYEPIDSGWQLTIEQEKAKK